MPAAKRTAQAEEDLFEIWGYVAQDNHAAADRLLDAFDRAFSLLAEQPALGPARPDIAPQLRYFPHGNYLILYRVLSDGIEVVRVVPGSRRIENVY